MHQLHIILAVGGGIILVLGLVSGFIKNRLWISEPLVCLAVGAALRPALDGAFDPASGPGPGETLLRETARVTLAVAVMGAALRLPARYLRENWRSLAVILGLGMPLMWLAGGLLAWLLLPVSALAAMLIGAVLHPLLPALGTRRDALFAGWFGPIGVAAVFYAMLGVEKTGVTTLWPVVSAVVVLSVVLHGVSATPLSEWFGRARNRAA